MKGFPDENPPSICGPSGPLGGLVDATSEIVTKSYSTMCDSYNSTCDVGVLFVPLLGGHGLPATTCPETLAYPSSRSDSTGAASVAMNTIIGKESCAAPTTPGVGFVGTQPSGSSGARSSLAFKEWAQILRNDVVFNNVRYGTTSAATNEVIPYNLPSAVKTDTCKYRYCHLSLSISLSPFLHLCLSPSLPLSCLSLPLCLCLPSTPN